MQYFRWEDLHFQKCFALLLYYIKISEQVSQHNELRKMKKTILNRIEITVQKAKEYSEKFSEYSFLWTNNRKQFLGR